MKLHYTLTGTTKPVVLLVHGFLGSALQWLDTTTFLNRDFDILLVELPGHGASVEASSDYALVDVAHAINDILIQLQIVKLHVVGHSMGGYICSAFAKAYPVKTRSLTLINSIAGSDSAPRKTTRNRAIKLIEKYQEAYVSMAVSNLFTDDERGAFEPQITLMKNHAANLSITSIIQALKAMRDRPSCVNGLKDIPFPIRYISGVTDAVIAESVIKDEIKKVNADHASVHGGHMIIVTHTAELQKELHFIE